jgi:hypothetical protein
MLAFEAERGFPKRADEVFEHFFVDQRTLSFEARKAT